MNLGRLAQDSVEAWGDPVEVWLNVFAGDAAAGEPSLAPIGRADTSAWEMGWGGSGDEVSDVVTRHVTSFVTPPQAAVERPPPGEPSPFWYQVGTGGLFYWQWAAIVGGVALLFVSTDGRGRRRR